MAAQKEFESSCSRFLRDACQHLSADKPAYYRFLDVMMDIDMKKGSTNTTEITIRWLREGLFKPYPEIVRKFATLLRARDQLVSASSPLSSPESRGPHERRPDVVNCSVDRCEVDGLLILSLSREEPFHPKKSDNSGTDLPLEYRGLTDQKLFEEQQAILEMQTTEIQTLKRKIEEASSLPPRSTRFTESLDGNDLSSSEGEEEENWVQCDSCTKWRRLPATVDASLLPDEWVCSRNIWDRARNRCSAPQELSADDSSLLNEAGDHLDDEALSRGNEHEKNAVWSLCRSVVEGIALAEGDDDLWLRKLHGILHQDDRRIRELVPWSPCGTAFGIHRDAIKLLGHGHLFSATRLVTFRRELSDFDLDVTSPRVPIDPEDIPDITCFVGSSWLSKSLGVEEFCALAIRAKNLRCAS